VSYLVRGDGRDNDRAAGNTGPGDAVGPRALHTGVARTGGRRIGGAHPHMTKDGAVDGPGVDIPVLFRQHYTELVRLAVMLVGDRATAEDAVQDVFTKLHARRERAQPQGDALTYVRVCVLNACRTVLRKRALLRRFGAGGPTVPDLPHESAEHEVMRAEGRREVLAALATLPPRRREVLVLSYYLGLTEHQIAEVLRISPGTVKSTKSRALAALARTLGEES
jgi:RNA polymerase sigma-70 factor (sigma-E family)